jgi:hypothetical protein
MECSFASRALVVTARALEEESKELGYNRYLEAVGKMSGRRPLLIGAGTLDTLSNICILLSPILLQGALCNLSLA